MWAGEDYYLHNEKIKQIKMILFFFVVALFWWSCDWANVIQGLDTVEPQKKQSKCPNNGNCDLWNVTFFGWTLKIA